MMKEDVKLAKWLEGSMSDDELKAFMASPGYDTYSKIKEYSAELTAPEADMDSLYAKIQQNRERQVRVRRLNPWIGRVAAILLIAFALTYFFLMPGGATTQTAALGEHIEFLLPDDSQVVLNAGSEAEYASGSWSDNREVKLKGEAYFKVAKGKKFDVVTPQGTVTVVGTQFNVKARNNRLEVICYEGKVKVDGGSEEILLAPGQSVIFIDGKNTATPPAESLKPGWIAYDVAFRTEELKDVIAEMERQYKIDIELPDGEYAPYNGPIPMNDLDKALEIIKPIYGLKAQRADGKIILTRE